MIKEAEREEIRCNVCGSDNSETLFNGQDHWFNLPGEFPVRQCQTCGLIYLNPRPTRHSIGAYYPESYQPYRIATEDIASPLKRWEQATMLQKRINAIQKRHPSAGSVLDVGCATGTFLDALRQAGWQPHGVEPNEKASAYARERLNLDVFTGELGDAPFAAQSFDMVIFWDVLEHVFDSRASLEKAAHIAKADGTLILSLPNPHSNDAKLFGEYWAGWDIPRHLQVFPIPVIERLLAETGWQMEEIICMSGRHWLFNLSLQHWLEARVSSRGLRRLILAITRSIPFRILTLPYFMLIEKLKRGSIMVIFAQRDAQSV